MPDYQYQLAVSINKTGSLACAYKVVIGVGTAFLTDLTPGQTITIGANSRVIDTILSDTLLLVTVAFPAATSLGAISSDVALTGTASGSSGFAALNGSVTLFLTELTGGDVIFLEGDQRIINTVTTNTAATITTTWSVTHTGKPVIRRRAIAGTAQVATLIYVIGTGTAFTTDFTPGDFVTLGAEYHLVNTIINDTLMTVTAAFSAPATGGSVVVAFKNVEDMGIAAPKGIYRPWTKSEKIGNGSFRGYGSPLATWHWGFLTQTQRDTLRAFCPGKSALVYIQTREMDNADDYLRFSAYMIWPDEEERDASRRPDFKIEFFALQSFP